MERNKEAYQLLEKFVGSWHTEGLISSLNGSPEITIKGTDTYEWILDGYFLLHRADVIIGVDKNQTHEIIGYDDINNHYTMQYYNSMGNSGAMIATVNGNSWTFTGDKLRFRGGFNEHEDVFSGVWEQFNDLENWVHFMDIKLILISLNNTYI